MRTAQGRVVPVSETVWMRTREVWLHAVDLDNGGSFLHFPAEFIDALLVDVLGNWRKRRATESIPNLMLVPDDRDTSVAVADDGEAGTDAVVLRGAAAALARWATGRGSSGVTAGDGAAVPAAPRWL